MAPELPIDPDSVRGFLDPAEGEALYRHGCATAALGPLIEIGSYCGRSTVFLGCAARDGGGVVLALDHHRGSEEHQRGEAFHDPALYDAEAGAPDTLREFRRTLRRADLEDWVIPVVARAATFAAHFGGEAGLLFIDGGHSLDSALDDYRTWCGRLRRGGVLAIHDVYPDAAAGGQAPAAIHRLALASGLFREREAVASLRLLERL